MDTFKNMTELLGQVPPGGNYVLNSVTKHNTKVKLFAPHGGCIEPGTGILVAEMAGEAFDCFVFQGIRKKGCFKTLHVTSTNYDEPTCVAMASSATVAVAIHGSEGESSFIEVGGGNVDYVASLHKHLSDAGYPSVLAPVRRGGTSKNNFINLAQRNGVQLELSVGFRRSLFPGFPSTMQRTPAAFRRFVECMHTWLRDLEATLRIV